MDYGICHLSIVPLRAEPADTCEMVTQVLYGEHFKIIEVKNQWCRIALDFDGYEGWINSKQLKRISEEEATTLKKLPQKYASDLVDFISNENGSLIPICLGSSLSAAEFLNHKFEGNRIEGTFPKENILKTVLPYLNAPYLWGGKTPFGIDCSGFTQMVYKLNGYKLLRDASQQATQGETLGFIEESEPGDLAFFENEEGTIIHVGIILKDNYIIHAHGQVRIDRLDHWGIFNSETQRHTHKLRIIKRVI